MFSVISKSSLCNFMLCTGTGFCFHAHQNTDEPLEPWTPLSMGLQAITANTKQRCLYLYHQVNVIHSWMILHLCVFVFVCRFLDEVTKQMLSSRATRASWLIEFPGYNNYIMLQLPVTPNLIGAQQRQWLIKDTFVPICVLVCACVCVCVLLPWWAHIINRCSPAGLLGLRRAFWLI